jgi:L-fuculose-phosphate aldolase
MREVGRDLYLLGHVSSHGGNLSIRARTNQLWITGTGTMLGRLEPRHISFVEPDGSYEGPRPSTDTVLHSTIYAIGGAQAVVHAHPHHAIAVSFDTDRFVPLDFEGLVHLHDVPVIENDAVAIPRLATALQNRKVALLRGHGAYAVGDTLWEALHWITALEESAHIATIRLGMRQSPAEPDAGG